MFYWLTFIDLIWTSFKDINYTGNIKEIKNTEITWNFYLMIYEIPWKIKQKSQELAKCKFAKDKRIFV